MRGTLMRIATMDLSEGKVMIEAQQRDIEGAATQQALLTTGEKAVKLFNRLVERLARDGGRRAEQWAGGVAGMRPVRQSVGDRKFL